MSEPDEHGVVTDGHVPAPPSPNEQDVLAALAIRYPAPQFAFLEQVSTGTGWAANRRLDAIAMSLWPSRGLGLLGFEVKCYRGDWIRELREPAKAEEIFGYLDGFAIVTSSRDLVKPGELPPTWGLMCLNGKAGIRTIVPPPELTETKPVSKMLLAAILRRVTEQYVPKKSVDMQRIGVAERALEKAKNENGEYVYRLETLERTVAEFEKASGVEIKNAWMVGEIGAAVKALRNTAFRENLNDAAVRYRKAAERLEQAAVEIDRIAIRSSDAVAADDL